MTPEIQKLEEQIKLMKTYLLHKVDIEDWHGVYDSAIDIRCLTLELEIAKKYMQHNIAQPSGDPTYILFNSI